MALRFRDATTDDTDAIVALVESGYRGEASRIGWTTEADLLDGQRTDADDVRRVIAAADSRLLLAERDDELVGCCRLVRNRDGSAYFGMFAVRPALQGGGIGRSLLSEAERVGRDEWGCETMRMMVLRQRGELIAWYGRLGYTPTGATEPFPYGDTRYGIPKRHDLEFVELASPLNG